MAPLPTGFDTPMTYICDTYLVVLAIVVHRPRRDDDVHSKKNTPCDDHAFLLILLFSFLSLLFKLTGTHVHVMKAKTTHILFDCNKILVLSLSKPAPNSPMRSWLHRISPINTLGEQLWIL
ncbi:hypothetical protein BDP27DRAFT_347002 [Rhodocollybia butyracea]|uniref:Uncharacterized protein n=1 Tax=Rhodocollybia butyracea TaxID=206335 RepID=A0A9P5Q4X8_9AGAR|nr:hypothetical protein BDP27DRAFT_347002 [Rhodocollybia butyracea]